MKIFKGTVISTKMEKTATVLVERVVKHPVYKKRYKTTKKYHVHDPFGVKVGQEVEFIPSKPYSKLKRWIITNTEDDQTKKEAKQTRKTKSKTKKSKKK